MVSLSFDPAVLSVWIPSGYFVQELTVANGVYQGLSKTGLLARALTAQHLNEIQKLGYHYFVQNFPNKTLYAWNGVVDISGRLCVPRLQLIGCELSVRYMGLSSSLRRDADVTPLLPRN